MNIRIYHIVHYNPIKKIISNFFKIPGILRYGAPVCSEILIGRFWDKVAGGDLHTQKRKAATMWDLD